MGEVAQLHVHAGQREVLNDPHRFRVVVAGRRWGKSQVSKIAIIKESAKPNQLIWYVAPSYRMARTIMWNDLCASIPGRLIRRKHETLMVIELLNGSIIELKGADNPDALRGVGLNFLVMDEIQDMKPDTWQKVLRPTLASTRGRGLFIGTPKAFNFLHDLYTLGQRGETYLDSLGKRRKNDWKSWQFPTIMSPFIPRSEVEAAKEDMDEKTFAQEFMACHLPETEILLASGRTKKICDAAPGDELIHVDPDGERYITRVLKAGPTGEKIIMDAVLETGEVISASAHHKFKVHHAA